MSANGKEAGGDPIVDGESPELEPCTPDEGAWLLRLHVAGRTERSGRALEELRRLCDEYLPDRYCIEVIDLLEIPRPDAGEPVLAVPTVVRVLPLPMKRVVGDLSDAERVRWALGLGLPGTSTQGP